MANNRIQIKRTSVSGRTANVTNSGNSQYIAAGELALNMADGILYSSNGSSLVEIGSNTTTQRITNSLILDNNKPVRFSTVNTSAVSYFIQQNDDNFVFYSTNTSYGARPVWSIYANSVTSNLQFSVPLQLNSGLVANGSIGTPGQTLASNGTSVYWATVSGTGTVTQVNSANGIAGGPITSSGTLYVVAGNNTIFVNASGIHVNTNAIPPGTNVNAQYTWNNNHTFQSNVAFTGNNISVVSNTGSVMFAGSTDTNWRIGRNTGSTTKFFYSNNTLDIIVADSNLEGFVIGKPGGNSYFETGYAGTFTRNPIYVGNASVNVTINSTSFSGTANNATNLGGIGSESYLRSDAGDIYSGGILQIFNDSGALGSATGAANTIQIYQGTTNADAFMTFHVSGDTAFHFGLDGTTNDLFVGGWSLGANKYKIWHQNNDGAGSGLDADTLDGSHASSFQTTAGLAANVATLTANNTSFVGTVSAANVVSNAQLSSNLANYQTTAGLSANVATLTANSATYLGGNTASDLRTYSDQKAANAYSNAVSYVDGKSYVNTSQLSTNLANYQTTAGLASNVATLTANNTSFVGTVSAANVVSNAQLSANLTNYQTTAGLSSNVATLTANNTSFVGTVSAANVVSNAQLSSNLANYAALAGASFTGNVSISPNLSVGNSTVNATVNSTAFRVGNSVYSVTTDQFAVRAGNSIFYTDYAQGSVNRLYSPNGSYSITRNDASSTTDISSYYEVYSGGAIQTVYQLNQDANKISIDFLNVDTGISLVSNATQAQISLQSGAATATINSTSFSGTANNADYLDGQHGSYYAANSLLANYALLSGASFSGNVTANNANTLNDLNVGRNLTVSGNLIVTGNVTIVAANTLEIVDNFIYLNSNNTTQNEDIGIAGNYNDGTYAHTGIFRDATDGYWKVFDGYTPEPDAAVNIDTSNNTFNIAGFWANNIRLGNTTVYSTANSTVFSGTANNTSFVGTVSAANVVSNAQLSSNLSNYQTTAGLAANVATLTANNADYLDGQHGAYYTNATNITTGTLPYAQIPANVINTTAAFTRTGVTTFSANVILGSSGLSANASFGTAGHVLHSNGTATYWAADDQGVTSVATGNGLTGGTITSTGTVSVLANTGIVANVTGVYVNSAYIATIASNSASYANASITNTFTVGTASYFVANGNLGVGTASPSYTLQVNGSFAATTKSFVIEHPTEPNMKLRYGSLEGPENGVYVRGKLENKSVIELPDYWWNLIDSDTVTVNLTPYGSSQDLWVQSTSAYYINLNQPANCYFTVFAERKDVDRLVVEF